MFILVEDATIDSSDVLNALALFGEDQEGAKSFVVNPATLPTVRQDVNFADNQLFDLDVIVSNRVPVGSAYIIKPEGLGLYMSKETEILIDEDVLNFSTVISAYSLFATHVRDESKVIRLAVTGV